MTLLADTLESCLQAGPRVQQTDTKTGRMSETMFRSIGASRDPGTPLVPMLWPSWISVHIIPRLKHKIILTVLLLALALMALRVGVVQAADSRLRVHSAMSSELKRFVVLPEKQEHGLSQKAEEIARVASFSITNSIVVSWIVALGLIIVARVATRNMKPVPGGLQNFVEWLVESLYGFLEGIIGPHLVKRTFWFFATIFIFILATNWMGLIPGVGSIGWGHRTPHGFVIDHPLFRGVNADVNMTLAMALVFFACWIIWALQEVGPVGFLKELFAPKGETTGLLKLLMILVFFVAGCLEIVSILFRPISLSFRLYGNVFAGENLLEAMAKMVPGFGWLLPIPFYFLELLVGLVQALVFMLLTAVFTMLICQHEAKEPAAAH